MVGFWFSRSGSGADLERNGVTFWYTRFFLDFRPREKTKKSDKIFRNLRKIHFFVREMDFGLGAVIRVEQIDLRKSVCLATICSYTAYGSSQKERMVDDHFQSVHDTITPNLVEVVTPKIPNLECVNDLKAQDSYAIKKKTMSRKRLKRLNRIGNVMLNVLRVSGRRRLLCFSLRSPLNPWRD